MQGRDQHSGSLFRLLMAYDIKSTWIYYFSCLLNPRLRRGLSGKIISFTNSLRLLVKEIIFPESQQLPAAVGERNYLPWESTAACVCW